MIYEFPDTESPIRQGDIFIGLPRMEISLNQILMVDGNAQLEAKWLDLANKKDPMYIIVPVRPVAAIVATQDCDASRSRDITLCEIRDFRLVEAKSKDTSSPKKWKSILTQHARINQKWFYLPPCEQLGFYDKKAVDFLMTLRLPRKDLENLRSMRYGRLNEVADEHFRERIGQFFRRYPYDEWYALNEKEFEAYKNEYPDTKPYPWQYTFISKNNH